MVNLQFKCPTCSRKLRGVPLMQNATQVVQRTCRCGERWRLIVRVLKNVEGFRIDAAHFTFLGKAVR